MNKLTKQTKAWRDVVGKVHNTSEEAFEASASSLLTDLSRRIDRASSTSDRVTPGSIAWAAPSRAKNAQFLTAASWFKENPELVKLLMHYDVTSPDGKKGRPSDYNLYKVGRKKNGAVFESYDQWKKRVSVPKFPPAAPTLTTKQEAALEELDQQLNGSYSAPKPEVSIKDDERATNSVLGDSAKSLSKYPA